MENTKYARRREGRWTPMSRFDISASGIGFDLITRLLRPGLVESTCRARMRSEQSRISHCAICAMAWGPPPPGGPLGQLLIFLHYKSNARQKELITASSEI